MVAIVTKLSRVLEGNILLNVCALIKLSITKVAAKWFFKGVSTRKMTRKLG